MTAIGDDVCVTDAPSEPVQVNGSIATVPMALATALRHLGVARAFGVSGGGVCGLADGFVGAGIEVVQTRHESGAAFMALESSIADDRPAVVFVTTGPGITNALTGLAAARADGGRVILVAGGTAAAQRGRGAFQETSVSSPGFGAVVLPGPIFHDTAFVERAAQLPVAIRRLAAGLRRPNGFVGGLVVAGDAQGEPACPLLDEPAATPQPQRLLAPPRVIEQCAELLNSGPFAIWAGFGARHAGHELRELANRAVAPVLCSPRAKGVIPEDDELFLGVTGLGGAVAAEHWIAEHRPEWMLVLGTRLGENTSSGWSESLRPRRGYIHVDVDPAVAGVATDFGVVVPVVSHCQTFLEMLTPQITPRQGAVGLPQRRDDGALTAPMDGQVRPEVLFAAIQSEGIDRCDTTILSEAGNSFAWTTSRLRFRRPLGYRVSSGFGSMGHASAGVVATALVTGRRAVAVLGDAALLMSSELTTAVATMAPATWIVLNDGASGMVQWGAAALGFSQCDYAVPPVDFAAWAMAQGVPAVRVDEERGLASALESAFAVVGPSLVDVVIEPGRVAPLGARLSLLSEMAGGS